MRPTKMTALIVFLISALSVAAQDFSLDYPVVSQDVCSCSAVKDPFLIENGDEDAIYAVAFAGSAATWVSLDRTQFDLQAGKRALVAPYLVVPCDARGDYYLETYFQNSFGTQKKVVQKFTAGKCSNIQVATPDYNKTACACEPIRYSFDLKNTGAYKEEYSLSVGSEYVNISEDSVSLGPGESEEIMMTASFPCDAQGSKTIELITQTRYSNLKATSLFFLGIERCYDYEISADDVALCEGIENRVTVELTNEGRENTFSMTAAGVDWLKGERNITMGSNDTEEFTLIAEPPVGSLGNYPVKLSFISKKGELRKEKELDISVSSCHSPSLQFAFKPEQELCGSLTYPVELKNNGSIDSVFELSYQGPDFASLTEDRLMVPAGGSYTTYLKIDPTSCEYPGVKTFTVSGTLESRPDLDFSDTISTEIQTPRDHYRIIAKNTQERISYDTYSMVVPVKNVGSGYAEYDIYLSGPEWMQLDRSLIGLGRTQWGGIPIVFDAEDVSIGDYEAMLTLSTEGVEYSFPMVVKLRQSFGPETLYSWFAMVIPWMPFIAAAVFVAILALIVVYAVLLVRRRKKERSADKLRSLDIKIRLLWIMLILIILAAVWGAFFYMNAATQPEPAEEIDMMNDSLAFVWDANEQYVINLSDYFFDPEGQALTFSSTDPSHIDVIIQGEKATFRPESGWTGKEYVMLFAKDDSGQQVESPPIALIVAGDPGIPRAGLILYGLLVLVIIVLFVRVLWENRKEDSVMVKK